MADETVRRGIGRFSIVVYPILAALFFYFGITYEFKRIDLVMSRGNQEFPLAEWQMLRNEFLLIMGGIVLATIIWRLLVVRERKKHPERYRKY